ncbi:MAG: PadR family transcriptional regulator [Promethearchaeota archaeon]
MAQKIGENNIIIDTDDLDPEEIEKMAFKAVKQMRKGFISALILTVLQENECHGYGIIKEIEEKTKGIWTPTTSSIYPVLKDLKKKELVHLFDKEESEGKIRKIYQITPKGTRFLTYFVRQFQTLMTNLRTLTMGAFGLDGNYPLEDHFKIMADHPVFGWENKASSKEKEENLQYYKELIEERILDLQNFKQYIEEELGRLIPEDS